LAEIIRDARISLHGISTVAITADLGCRAGWEKNFVPLLKKVEKEHRPGAYIVAGDLSLNSDDGEYCRILNHIEKTNAVWITVPGDHDRPVRNFMKYFGATRKVADIDGWRFIGLNTANRMFLKREEEWLEANIRKKSIIFSHVPPEAEGWTFHSLWPRSSNRFLRAVKKHRKYIHAMYFGHIHGFSEREYLGIPMIVTGAVAESLIVRDNRYQGKGFFEMVIMDTATGNTELCTVK